MINTLQTTDVAMATVAACPKPSLPAVSLTGPAAAGLFGPAVSAPGGIRLRGGDLSGRWVTGSVVNPRDERPIQAPEAAMAHRHLFAYAAANGAASASECTNAAAASRQMKKRAFRGLEPWRDPA